MLPIIEVANVGLGAFPTNMIGVNVWGRRKR